MSRIHDRRADDALVVLTASEALFLVTVVTAATLGAYYRAAVAPFLAWVAIYGLALVVVWLVAIRVLRLDRGLGRGLADVALTFVVYGALTPLIAPLGARAIDGVLWRAEEWMFGTTLVRLMEPLASPGWTTVFSLIYSVHLPLFIVPATLHWYAGRRDRAERLLLTLALAMYIGFAGYAIFPAYGPIGAITGLRHYGDTPATDLVAIYGVAIGTFPSLHAGISAAVAIDGWRTSRRWGMVLTLIAAAIWVSTIYLRYHWFLDLLAGLVLAAGCTWLAARILAAYPLIAIRRPSIDRAGARPAELPAGE